MNSSQAQEKLAANCRPQILNLVNCEQKAGRGSKRCEAAEQEVIACAAYALCPNQFENVVQCLEDNQMNEKKCERLVASLQKCMESFE